MIAARAPAMPVQRPDALRPTWFRTPAATALGAALACLALVLVLIRSWAINLHIPFASGGDGLYFLSIVRGLLHNQTWWHNQELGYPWGAELRDFPVNMTVDYALLWLAGKIIREPGLLLNLYWIAATSLNAGLAAYSFTRLGIHRWAAFFTGVLYALQPYAIYRNTQHLDLLFYCVPILMGFAVEWMSSKSGRVPWQVRTAAVVQGLSYVYNAFFACLLFGAGSAIMWVRNRTWKSAAPGLIVIGLIAAAFIVNTSPNLALWIRHGSNPEVAYKMPYESEAFALKIRHLITPISNHPLHVFRSIAQVLDRPPYDYETENRHGRLGTVGSLGFLILLGYALLGLAGWPVARRDRRLGVAAALMLTALLVATVGGFSSVLITVSSDIRAYNRMVVFISYLSFLTIGILLTEAHRKFCSNRSGLPFSVRWIGRVLVLVLLILTTLDETSTRLFGDYAERANDYYSVQPFVRQMEARFDPGAALFMLPQREFPVERPLNNMGIYDHFKPYVYSSSLRLSYGAIKGRGTEWSAATSTLPAEQMATRLVLAGFSAVWIDLEGYASGGNLPNPANSPLPQFQVLPKVEVLMSANQRYAVVDLRGYRQMLSGTLGQDNVQTLKEAALYPVVASMRDGFFRRESNAANSWNWARRRAYMVLNNRGNLPRMVTVQMTLLGIPVIMRNIQIHYPGGEERLVIPPAGRPYRLTINIPAHEELPIRFAADGDSWSAPGDMRDIYFGVGNLSIQQSDK